MKESKSYNGYVKWGIASVLFDLLNLDNTCVYNSLLAHDIGLHETVVYQVLKKYI